MKSLFTVHGGEYLAGTHIEKMFKKVNIWVPTHDIGVDLLVSDSKNTKFVSLQVKSSINYVETYSHLQQYRAHGWFTLNPAKIRDSIADYWVFLIFGNEQTYIVIEPSVLYERLLQLRGAVKTFHSYLTVTKDNKCYETRGMKEPITPSKINAESNRDFTKYLSNWTAISEINKR
jgi:hypothetical protein